MLDSSSVYEAYDRLQPFVTRTPLLSCSLLNEWLGHEIWFKAECMQKTGSFKFRGSLNALLALRDSGKYEFEWGLPVVTVSSGNHGQALAAAGQLLGCPVVVHMARDSALVKQQAVVTYGATLCLHDSRQVAEAAVRLAVERGEGFFVPPFDFDEVIAGQGTVCFEALQERPFDAVFAPCGGGGLLSGSYLACQALSPDTAVFGAEPVVGNDAAQSFRAGHIVPLDNIPDSLADGARTLSVCDRTFAFLQKLDGFFEVDEADIVFWVQWLTHLLRVTVEPTGVLGMAGACQWLRSQPSPAKVLVVLSGGNFSCEARKVVWGEDLLGRRPLL